MPRDTAHRFLFLEKEVGMRSANVISPNLSWRSVVPSNLSLSLRTSSLKSWYLYHCVNTQHLLLINMITRESEC